jgi:hypothetical protein
MNAMDINWPLVVQIGSPILTLFAGAFLNHLLERRERVIAHLGHIASFKLEGTKNEKREDHETVEDDKVVATQSDDLSETEPRPEDRWVYTHSVVVRNTGRKTATNVRLGHNILPNVTISPDIDYSIKELPGGGKDIVIPKLVPKKEITISYLYFPPLTWGQINTHLESDNGPIKVIKVLLQGQPPKWLLGIIWTLLIVGLIGVVYSVVEIGIAIAT